MLVDELALIIVFWVFLAVCPRQCLSRFIGFKAYISPLMLFRAFLVPEPIKAKHKVVVRLQVFRIDRQNLLKFRNRIAIFALQKEDPSQLVAHNAVTRILREHLALQLGGAVILAVRPKSASIEKHRPGEVWLQLQSL